MIDTLNKDLNKEKQRVLELTRTYENEINNLSHEKARLNEEVDALNHENTALNVRLNEC
jgi:predicted nuclease with TOPRIM domain